MITKPMKRVAIYCRVSSDERLSQEFNSIDAQRLAGEAYISSQAAEGWVPIPDRYEDGGYSGGNLERPALKQLMADIENHRIDIVLVYKVDRLSRSISDFAKLVEVFDAHDVTFCSITQPINSGDSMGRLMLNVLLSFAQFEREVTAERIRDKIAASKRLGMWMGGRVPLGYDVSNRQLVINEAEANLVRRIFEDFLKCRSSTQVATTLTQEGYTTKSFISRSGRQTLGSKIDKQFIFKVLRNRIYRGEIQHKGIWYPGQHEAIIDHGLWGQVHEILAEDAIQRTVGTKQRARTDVLLRGLLYANGERMQPTFTRKSGRQYKYYVSKSEHRFGAASKGTDRIPADEIDAVAIAQIKNVLTSPEAMIAVCRQLDQVDPNAAIQALSRIGEVWERLFPQERHRIAHLMIERVELVEGGIKMKWHELGWKSLIGEFTPQEMKLLEAA